MMNNDLKFGGGGSGVVPVVFVVTAVAQAEFTDDQQNCEQRVQYHSALCHHD